MQSITKKAFFDKAVANGLCLLGVMQFGTLEQAELVGNTARLEGIKRLPCEVRGKQLVRLTEKGPSYLNISGSGDSVHQLENGVFLVASAIQLEGSNPRTEYNCIFYA